MKRRIKRIGPLQAGKMLGVLYAAFGLIFIPFFALAVLGGAFAQHAQASQSGATAPAAIATGVMLIMALLLPVFYGVMGFIVGVIGAAIYNLVAQWIGGIEVEVE